MTGDVIWYNIYARKDGKTQAGIGRTDRDTCVKAMDECPVWKLNSRVRVTLK